MNLFPEPRPGGRCGGEAGAARGCSAPAPSRRAAGLAGVGYGCPFGALRRAFRSPFRRHGLPTPFRRRPFIGVLLSAAFCRRPFSAARPLGTVPLFCARRNSPDQLLLVSVSSPLRPLSAPTPLRSAPSPSRPVPVPSPFRPRSSPRPCPCPCPCPCPVPVPFLSRFCPVPVPFLSPLRSVPFPSRSCLRPLFWRGAASSLFFGPRVEKPEKLFRFVISK